MAEKVTKKKLTTEQRKARVEEMKAKFNSMTKEAAIDYLSNIYINAMDKATIAAFMSVYTEPGDDDRKWFANDFQKEATEEVAKREKKDLDKPIQHKNRKGYVVSEKNYVFEEVEGETQRVYKRIKAAQAFADHFGFTYKSPEEYDEFAELL